VFLKTKIKRSEGYRVCGLTLFGVPICTIL